MPAPLTGLAVGTSMNAVVPLSATGVQCSVFVIRAPLTNSATVFIGGKTVSNSTGYPLDPGSEFTYDRNTQQTDARRELTVSDFYMTGNANDVVGWFASPVLS